MRTARDDRGHRAPGQLSTSDPFGRVDPTDDATFYGVPRLVTHIDEGAIEALRHCYDGTLPERGRILDLMSSWRSHLPARIERSRVVGLGMNAEEMRANPQIGSAIVHDLNRESRLPFATASFAAAGCAVSVQYLLEPVRAFAEVRRVLQPRSPFVVSFSNRCFPTKAVFSWLTTDDEMHRRLVASYLADAGFREVRDAELASRDDPMYVVIGRA